MLAVGTLKAGDQVWVKTGFSGGHEELGTILSININPAEKTRHDAENKSNANNDDDDNGGCGIFPDASGCGILVKFSVSGSESLVTKSDRIRPMEDMAEDKKDASGRTLRRSGRSSKATSALLNVGAASDGGGSAPKKKKSAAKKKLSANSVRVTPSPTELDSESPSSNASKEEVDDEVMEDFKPPANNKRKRASVAKTAPASNKKTKASTKAKSDDASKKLSKSNAGTKNDKATSLILASGEDNETEGATEKKAPSKAKKVATATKGKKAVSATSAARGGKKLIVASGEDEIIGATEKKAPSKPKKTAAAAKGKKEPKTKKATSATKPPKKEKKASIKRETQNDTSVPAPAAAPADAAEPAAPVGNQPDGNGGLNQPIPWVVECAKTGRATCKTCDEKIKKGEVRVGHTPLFRGKPGFMVYRHLHCTTFSEHINSAQDVKDHETLSEEDHLKLVEQVEISKENLKVEQQEIRPDELVQKTFEGEIRSKPEGLAATLLPFQVEGFSWMRHQEVMEEQIRGGILADEMGMGKTIQAIATILDNRPKLQHTSPGMKHPPTPDLPQRQSEERLWDKAKADWDNEMELLKVPKKLLSLKKGGARAGTLVICPVIALTQWKTEIEKFTEEEGTLTVGTYHGPDREKLMPKELLRKYDVVLTTYQVLEQDFRKMISPNRVECPNCGGKFKIDKLPIHLKYFCGDSAQKTEAQSRQVRASDGGGGNGSRRGRRPGNADGNGNGGDEKGTKKKKAMASKEKTAEDEEKKPAQKKKSEDKKKSSDKKKKPPVQKKKPAKKPSKKAVTKQTPPKSNSDEKQTSTSPPRAASSRSAARKAASQISRSAAEWAPPDGDSSDSDKFQSEAESSNDDSSASENDPSSEEGGYSSDSSSDDSVLERATEKQRQALEMSQTKKKPMAKKKQPASKAKGKKALNKKPATKGKGKGKKFDDDSDDDYSSSDSIEGDGEDEIDMVALVEKAMAGAKNAVLHSVCWWRIILDEAHFIKSRSSQTAKAAHSLIGVHRWCLSGTPLQNRVGEFYSLVRFLRLDPMAYYCCRAKGCDCKSMHYRMFAGRCEGCGHSSIQHYSHFNKYILNPIQRDGYTGDGRRAMFLLKDEVLDKALLRRTKETKAADLELPPRLVQIKTVKLHPVEEDFYSALYTQTKSSFNDYVDSGTLLNNYAHIFDLLIRMRQSVDHPYLVVYSKKNCSDQMRLSQLSLPGDTPAIANGSVDCDLCHEPPTDRVVSTCCGAAYCRACVLEYMTTSNSMAAASANLICPSCRDAFSIDLQARADIEDCSSLNITSAAAKNGGPGVGMPSLKELKHVATGSILRRINLAEFATSSKIEALTRELVLMRQTSPGSKAIVFSQFVGMLDLIRWRLHSDPYLEDIGLGCRALHGGMNVKARDTVLKEFREDNNVRVLLMSLKAGGVALNLTCANYIYLMDPWWNPAAEMQAIDRTHRLGQYRPIRAVRFIAENTVEERILQLQDKKRLVFDGTVGRDAGSLKMLTVDDMKSLFA